MYVGRYVGMYVCMHVYILPPLPAAHRPPHILELTHREHWAWCEYVRTQECVCTCTHAHMGRKKIKYGTQKNEESNHEKQKLWRVLFSGCFENPSTKDTKSVSMNKSV
jgi:hypothetical protein